MMVTLSVTRFRIAGVLVDAADLLAVEGWHPEVNPVWHAIDRAAGYEPGSGPCEGESLSLAAWDALSVHLGDEWPLVWELERTQAEVLAALRDSAVGVRQVAA
ncbi:hypothetical protein ACIOUE_00710 [Streptomyces xanthochromogenes]|uniref:hypothetical protein n=1 Tax=Streptomyces xanthochromogenes TaxID=67384 RepID=UPI0037F7D6E3